MCDFLIQFGPTDIERMSALLRDRPGMADAPIHTHEFVWGSVVVQEPRGRGYAPFTDDGELFACVARPRFVGVTHEEHGPDGFNRLFAQRWRRDERQALFDALTGMYALVHAHASGVDILTDQMGFQPVYATTSRPGTTAYGSSLEALAQLTDEQASFCPESLAEVLVYGYPTFPFTTRKHVVQLSPASLHEICNVANATSLSTTTYWLPSEPSIWPSETDLFDELHSVIVQSVADVSRAAPRVAVTLSGGIDSRAILAALPRDKHILAITYATRDNRELTVARDVAAAHNVPHLVAWRPDEYFSDLTRRSVQLQGMEASFQAQGLCILDTQLNQSFDLVLTGTLADALLKDALISLQVKEALRHKGIRERTKNALLRLCRIPYEKDCSGDWRDSTVRKSYLTSWARDAIASRRTIRLNSVRNTRPTSAEEWIGFWPCSQIDGHLLGNSKLYSADGPYMHRSVAEVARRIPMALRYKGRLANAVLLELCGSLGEIPNANTGVAANAPDDVARKARRQLNRAHGTLPISSAPWNDVQHSWVNYALLQKSSPRWEEYRQHLKHSPSLDVLQPILNADVRKLICEYDETLEPHLSYTLMRMALQVDAVL